MSIHSVQEFLHLTPIEIAEISGLTGSVVLHDSTRWGTPTNPRGQITLIPARGDRWAIVTEGRIVYRGPLTTQTPLSIDMPQPAETTPHYVHYGVLIGIGLLLLAATTALAVIIFRLAGH